MEKLIESPLSQRKTGYYWVKNLEKWMIAKYYSETKDWNFIGFEGNFDDSDLDEINEKVLVNQEYIQSTLLLKEAKETIEWLLKCCEPNLKTRFEEFKKVPEELLIKIKNYGTRTD